MSIHSSLRVKAGKIASRNVLTRAERIKTLADEEKWNPEKGVTGLPKVRVRKTAVKKKVKKADAAAAATAGKDAAKDAGKKK